MSRTTVLAAVVALLGLAVTAGPREASALTITDQIGVDNGGPIGALTNVIPSDPDGFIKSDLTWTHSYAVSGTILSASFEIDIIDADYGGLVLTGDGMSIGAADPSGYNSGGKPGPWRDVGDPLDPTFVFDLGPGFFPLLADGSFTVFGENDRMYIWGSNRAILTIVTDAVEIESTPPNPVPEPGTLTLFGIGLAGFGYLRRKRTV
jgi:hypothetical protein